MKNRTIMALCAAVAVAAGSLAFTPRGDAQDRGASANVSVVTRETTRTVHIIGVPPAIATLTADQEIDVKKLFFTSGRLVGGSTTGGGISIADSSGAIIAEFHQALNSSTLEFEFDPPMRLREGDVVTLAFLGGAPSDTRRITLLGTVPATRRSEAFSVR
jgi:hypothetical protein